MEQRRILFYLFVALSNFFVKEAHTCFTYNESHYTIRPSGSTFFQECACEEPVLSTHNIKWLDGNNREINASNSGSGMRPKVYTERGHHFLRLNIDKASPSLSGTYKCVSKDLDGIHYSKSYTIEFFDPLYFIPANITPQYIIKGQDSLIQCQGRGYHTPRISWYKGKEEIEINEDEKYMIKPEGLLIKNATEDDAGEYHCTARVLYTGEDVDTVIQVKVMIPPNIEDLKAIPDYVVNEGDTLIIICTANGYPLPTYTWRRIGDEANNTAKNVTWKQDTNKIVIENVTMEDQATYECIAQNIASEARSNISIEVLVPPKISEFENITAAEGSTISIVCGAIGRPQPYINITYDGELQESPGYYSTNENPTYAAINLTFEKVRRYHGGQYDCTANNSVGLDRKIMNLIVHHKPVFDKQEEIIWGWEGHPVNLSCGHTANPAAIVVWNFLGNNNLKLTPRQIEESQFWLREVQETTEHYILFKPLKQYFYGTYECVARNHLGDAKKIFHVKEGFRPPLLGKYQVNITDVAATSATFDFYGIEFEGPPIIGFTAEYDEVEKYDETDIHHNRTWAQNVVKKIDKLKPNTIYQARFAAINDVGTGPFGQYYTFETPTKSAPEPPAWEYEFEPVTLSVDNKILKLKPPEHNGEPIDYFALKICPENISESCIEKITSPTTELDLSYLHHNTSYRIGLIAHNSVGNSTPVYLQIFVEGSPEDEAKEGTLTGGAIIGIAVVVVILCIVILDVTLLVTKKKGIIATCMYGKTKKKSADVAQSKDKKGLLKDNTDPVTVVPNRTDNGHKEFEYNKSTGIITGKFSCLKEK